MTLQVLKLLITVCNVNLQQALKYIDLAASHSTPSLHRWACPCKTYSCTSGGSWMMQVAVQVTLVCSASQLSQKRDRDSFRLLQPEPLGPPPPQDLISPPVKDEKKKKKNTHYTCLIVMSCMMKLHVCHSVS